MPFFPSFFKIPYLVGLVLSSSILCIAGRLPNTKRLNLDAVGVELDNMKAVKVSNECFILLFEFLDLSSS